MNASHCRYSYRCKRNVLEETTRFSKCFLPPYETGEKKKEDRHRETCILTGEKSISCVIQSETRLLAHVASFIKAKQMPINIASELFIPLLFRYEDGQTTTQIGPCGLRRGELLVRWKEISNTRGAEPFSFFSSWWSQLNEYIYLCICWRERRRTKHKKKNRKIEVAGSYTTVKRAPGRRTSRRGRVFKFFLFSLRLLVHRKRIARLRLASRSETNIDTFLCHSLSPVSWKWLWPPSPFSFLFGISGIIWTFFSKLYTIVPRPNQ